MAQDIDTEALLDLSFLTEEEQEAIVEVLRRDSRLRVQEEGRISKLRESVSDPNQLKILTGAWFCDVRAKRHRHNHFGSDIVRASIRRKKKPKGEWEQKRSASAGDLEAISEPVSEGEGPLEVPDADRLCQEAVPQLPPPSETQDTSQSSEQAPESKPESTNPSSGEEEEVAADPSPALVLTGQTNGARQNSQEASEGSPLKNNSAGPGNKLMSSSVSSLSSSTLSGSMMSLYSDSDVGQVEVQGCIQFSLQYEARKKELQIQVIQCRDLAAAKKQRSDPYVKSYLLPDKSNHSKRKTAVKKRSLDPVFNEALKYKIEKVDLQGRILNLSVWHHDSLGRNLFMGEVELALSTWDWSNTGPAWFNLQPRTRVSPDVLASRGQLHFALKFIPPGAEGDGLPPTGELHIWVKAAQSLIPIRSGTMDSFIQCYVLPDDSKTSCQKTRVVKRSLSPVFNHTMVYDGFQAKDLREACAEFTLWEHETFAKQQLGGIRLSLGTGSSYRLPVAWMDSTEEERHVWESLLEQPLQWVEALLPLRTNLTPRT
ncbi:synaptotagmin-like protein 1 [Pelodiscus sinensis]|uniref:synaptotagmin-like protein 1 n=1 Tax=Pelodiscus sinensis TaxID=13735 RepID=UPI003F6A9456